MTSLLSAPVLAVVLVSTSGQAKPKTVAQQAQEARTAAACLATVASGKELPPAPKPQKNSPSALLSALEGAGPRTAERDALASCLPASTYFRLFVGRSDAKILSRCFEEAADVLEKLRGKKATDRNEVASATFVRDSCVRLAHRIGSQRNEAALFSVDSTTLGPGVVVSPVGRPDTVTVGAQRIIDRVDVVAEPLSACRDAHGEGEVVAAVRTGRGGHWARAFSFKDSKDRAPVALRDCVAGALGQMAATDDEDWWAVFSVRLTPRVRVVDDGDPLLVAKVARAKPGMFGLGLGAFGPSVPMEAREQKVGGRVVLTIQVTTDGRAFVVSVQERPQKLGAAFERSCRNEVKQLRFERPQAKDGQPVEARLQHVCEFNPEQYPKPMKRRPPRRRPR